MDTEMHPMGEVGQRANAERGPMGGTDAMARMVRCAYRRAETVLAVPPADLMPPDEEGEDALGDAVLDVVDEVRMPSALRPRGLSLAGDDAAAEVGRRVREAVDPSRVSLFDRDGAFLRAVDLATYAEAYGGEPGDGVVVRHAKAGEAVEVEGSLGGGFPGEAGTDPLAFFAGLVRVSSTGDALVAADAPLSYQAARLSDIMQEWEIEDEAEMASIADHVTHVLVLAGAVAKAASPDAGAWIDLSGLSDVMEEVMDEGRQALDEIVDADLVAMDLLDALDAARPGDPHWRVGPLLPYVPTDWIARDTPGSGAMWASVDATLRSMPWGSPPPRVGYDAALVVMPTADGAVLPRVRRVVARGEILCAAEGSLVTRHAALGVHVALLLGDGRAAVVAWSLEDSSGPRADPLMAETLGELVDEPPAPEGREDAAYSEAMDTAADMGVLAYLPSPPHLPDYGMLMLLAAHRRGLRVPDLMSCLATLAREGWADAAFREGESEGAPPPLTEAEAARRERVAAQAEAFGGAFDRALTAMLRGIEAADWGEIDLERDVRILADAVRAGLTLEDLSIAASAALADETEADMEEAD